MERLTTTPTVYSSMFSSLVVAIMFTLALSTPLAAQVSCSGVVKIGWINEQDVNKDRDSRFYALTLAEDVLTDIGCRSEFVIRPWSRLLQELEQGAVDIVPIGTFSHERAVFVDFTSPYSYVPLHLAIRRGDLDQIDPSDLDRLSEQRTVIGKIIGQKLGQDLETRFKKSGLYDHVVSVSKMSVGVQMLAKRRVDALIADAGFLRQQILANELTNQLIIHPVPVGLSPRHMMLSKSGLPLSVRLAIKAAVDRRMKIGKPD